MGKFRSSAQNSEFRRKLWSVRIAVSLHRCHPYLFTQKMATIFSLPSPLRSDRHPLSCDDCLEDKRKDYQNCSVLYCVPQLYTVISTHMRAVLTGVLGTAGLGLEVSPNGCC